MPGKIVALLVEAGASVAKGDALLVMEAMKMEMTVCAPADGKLVSFLCQVGEQRSEEHTSELQSLMRISYAVFCLKKKKKTTKHIRDNTTKYKSTNTQKIT